MTPGYVLAGLVAVCVTVLAVAGRVDGGAVLGVLAGLVAGLGLPTPGALRGRG
jgi:hypothetical protein